MPDKWVQQTKAAIHIRELLSKRSLNILSRRLGSEDEAQWIIFEHKSKQLGVDSDSGVWVRASELEDWRCVSKPCNVSGAAQAVEFLIRDK